MKKLIKFAVLLLSICILVVLYCTFLGTATVNGSSMYPTYLNEDFLLLSKVKSPEYGDIVAIGSDTLGKYLCKRIIGLEGDHIVINSTGLYRNDELLVEDYIVSNSWLASTDCVDTVVSDDCVFVLGDNRTNSTDSRVLGSLQKEALLGVVLLNLTKDLGITKYKLIKYIVVLWLFMIFLSILDKLKNSGAKKKDSEVE